MGMYVSEDMGVGVKSLSIDGDAWLSGYPIAVSLNLKDGSSVKGSVVSAFCMDRLLDDMRLCETDMRHAFPWIEHPVFIPAAKVGE